MVGEFKDDCLQRHLHLLYIRNEGGVYKSDPPNIRSADALTTPVDWYTGSASNARLNNITRGKRKGIKYIIKSL